MLRSANLQLTLAEQTINKPSLSPDGSREPRAAIVSPESNNKRSPFASLAQLARFLRTFFKFALRVLASSGGARVEVRVAQTAGDLDATGLIRREVYCKEKGFLTQDAVFDEYDKSATILNAFSEGEAAATVRLTDTRNGPLEIFQMHPELERMVPPGRYLEVSRLMVQRKFRGFRVTFPLFRAVYKEMLDRRADGLIMSCAPGLVPYYQNLLAFRRLGDVTLAHHHLKGLHDCPMLLEPLKIRRFTFSQMLGAVALLGLRGYLSFAANMSRPATEVYP